VPGALTTVTICWTPLEAGYLRDALEAEGIRSFVRESNLGTIDPFVTPALGGIRLDVDTEFVERARRIVADVRASLPAPKKGGPAVEEADRCPACRKPLAEEADACPSCGWGVDGAGEGEGWAPSPGWVPSTSGAFRITERAPGDGKAAAWTVLSLFAGTWLIGQIARSVLDPVAEPRAAQPLAPHDLVLLLVGAPLLIAAGILVARRGMRGRIRPCPSIAGPLARGLAAGVLLDLAVRLFWRGGAFPFRGAVAWFLVPFWGPALAVAWPALTGAGLRRTRAALGLVRGKGWLREASIGVLAFPAVTGVEILCDRFFHPDPGAAAHIYHALLSPSGWLRFWAIASVLVGAPVAEELLFRGAIYRFLRNSTGMAGAVILSSLLFAICHQQGWGAIPYLACFGAGAALLREWRGSLVAPIALHFAAWAWNLAVLYGTRP